MADGAAALTRHDLEAKIVKRCWEDEGFRREFTSDPAGAFAKYLGAERSALPKIVVHDEGAGSWHIVLPARPANIGELSDDELEKVAGGITPTIAPIFVITTAIASGFAVSGGVAISGAITVSTKGW